MDKSQCCPECGAGLPDDAPFGVCPPCLLRAGLGSASIENGAKTSGEGGNEVDETVAAAARTAGSENETNSVPVRRHIGEYELFEEIARGGMGVVYKARQVRLNRIVAVKMIRAGQLASEQDVERFFIEAEAAASLDHPGIVPIFEVGLEDEQPYFSMAFVEGESLASLLQNGPLDPNEAAKLTRKVSEAVTYAHSHGVIHRDLKPANILLDARQSDDATPDLPRSFSHASIGEPRVTDFGLAKHTNRRSDLTQTGQVLGTPSYMPPEQAQGKTEKINEKSDVYSLGAILYTSLTGRPPFQAASPMDTLLQVLEQDPVEPRQLNVGIPRDLETICLKCLEKEPDRRYDSSQALSDDLQRFLSDEPILARPMSLMDRGTRWLRKQGENVALSLLAMTATAIFVALAIASWYSYSRWQLGLVSLDTGRPPLVAEFLDTGGQHIAPAETIPIAEPVSLPANEYLLRVSGEGRLSETFRAQVQRDEYTELELDLEDQLHWPSLTIQRHFDMVHLDGRTDIIQLTDQGITRFDGEERWTARLQNSESPVLREAIGLTWPSPPAPTRRSGRGKYNLRPRFVSTSDLNGDDADDFVIAARHQAWVMGVSGATGEVLWLAARGADARDDPSQPRKDRRVHSAVVGRPKVAGDLDGDGVADLIATFADTGGRPTTAAIWVEAISAATGDTIWRFDIKPSWLSPPPGVEVPYHFRLFTGSASGNTSGGGGTSTSGRELTRGGSGRPHTERHGTFVYAPDEVHLCQRAEKRLAVLTAGDHVISLDVTSGKPVGPARKLAFRPIRSAVVAETDGDDGAELVYVGQKRSGPVSGGVELSVWSINEQRILFSKALQADYWMRPNFMIPRPRWPETADLDGDGRDEIIVPSGSSAYARVWPKSGWGNLNVIDGMTGERKWQRQLRTMDEQIDWFLAGPDINADGHREIFVATLLYKKTELYIDCLSGKDGAPLWSARHELNKRHSLTPEFWLGELRWWNAGRDGWPQLVVPVIPNPDRPGKTKPSTYVISAGTGKLRGIGQAMESARLADVDGDGLEELLSFRPTDGLDNGGTLDVIRHSTSEAWRRIGDTDWQSADDLNQDDYPDLIQTANGYVQAISGRDGASLWKQRLPTSHHEPAVALLGRDLNGDKIPDMMTVPKGRSASGRAYAPFHAISGRNGRLLWTADIDCNVVNPIAWVEARDLDQDGQMEVLLVNKLDWWSRPRTSFSSREGQLWLVALSGRSGAVKWKHALSGVDASGSQNGTTFEPRLDRDWLRTSLGDLNDDGVIDVVVGAERPGQESLFQLRAVSGDDGRTLWSHSLPKGQGVGDELIQSAPLVVDVDGDGSVEVILMEIETDPTNADRERNTVVRLKSLDRGTGTTRWQWQTQAHSFNAVGRGPLSNESLRRRRPMPALLRLSGKAESLICLNLWGSSAGVVLLDHNGNEQAKFPIADGDQPGIWPLDVDGDGNDELIASNNEMILAIEPTGDRKTIWQRPVKPALHDSVIEVVPATAGQPPLVVCKEGASIHGIDASTGTLAWTSNGPRDVGQQDASEYRVIPLTGSTKEGWPTVRGVVHTMGDVTVCQRPVAMGSPVLHRVAARLDGNLDDPRLLRDLPWMSKFVHQVETPVKAIVTLGWFMTLSALLIVVPALYLRQLVRRRSWSLAMFLWLPAVVGIILFSFTMPAPEDYQWLLPGERFMMGIGMLPAVVLPLFWTRWAMRRDWRRLFFWLIATVTLSFVIGAAILWMDSFRSGPGMGYSWKGWYTILVYGAYWIGWAMISIGFCRWFWGLITRIVRRPAAESAETNSVSLLQT